VTVEGGAHACHIVPYRAIRDNPPRMQLRPLRFPQLFDAVLNTTVKRFWALAGLVLAVAIPIRALEVVILTATISNPDDITSRTGFGQTGAATNGAAGVNVTVELLGALVTVIGTAVCFRIAAAGYAGTRGDWRSSVAFAAPRIGMVVWATIIAGVGVVLGFIALILPGIWLLVSWSVFIPALLFEGLSPTRSLGRSFELVRGRWWATLGLLIVATLISGVIAGIVMRAFDALMSTSLGNHVFPAALIDAVGGAVASAVGLPIQAVMVTLLYFDLRARKERLDTDLLARRLDIEPGTERVPPAASGTQDAPAGPPVEDPAAGSPVPEPEPEPEPAGAAETGGWAPPAPPSDALPPSEWAPPRPPRAGDPES
jgi:hypothetical protein